MVGYDIISSLVLVAVVICCEHTLHAILAKRELCIDWIRHVLGGIICPLVDVRLTKAKGLGRSNHF